MSGQDFATLLQCPCAPYRSSLSRTAALLFDHYSCPSLLTFVRKQAVVCSSTKSASPFELLAAVGSERCGRRAGEQCLPPQLACTACSRTNGWIAVATHTHDRAIGLNIVQKTLSLTLSFFVVFLPLQTFSLFRSLLFPV